MHAVVGYVRLAGASVEELRRANGFFEFGRKPRQEEETYVLIGMNDDDPVSSLDSTSWLYIYRQNGRSAVGALAADALPDRDLERKRVAAPLVRGSAFDKIFLPTTFLRLENYFDIGTALEQGRSLCGSPPEGTCSESLEADGDSIKLDSDDLDRITGNVIFAHKCFYSRELPHGATKFHPWIMLDQIPRKIEAQDIAELQYLIRDGGSPLKVGVVTGASFYCDSNFAGQTKKLKTSEPDEESGDKRYTISAPVFSSLSTDNYVVVAVDKSSEIWKLSLKHRESGNVHQTLFVPDAFDGEPGNAQNLILQAFIDDSTVKAELVQRLGKSLLTFISD